MTQVNGSDERDVAGATSKYVTSNIRLPNASALTVRVHESKHGGIKNRGDKACRLQLVVIGSLIEISGRLEILNSVSNDGDSASRSYKVRSVLGESRERDSVARLVRSEKPLGARI